MSDSRLDGKEGTHRINVSASRTSSIKLGGGSRAGVRARINLAEARTGALGLVNRLMRGFKSFNRLVGGSLIPSLRSGFDMRRVCELSRMPQRHGGGRDEGEETSGQDADLIQSNYLIFRKIICRGKSQMAPVLPF